MKKKLLLLGLAILFLNIGKVLAEYVPVEKAETVAEKAFVYLTGIKQTKIVLENAPIVHSKKNTDLFYIFNIENSTGYIIVSADDRIRPVLGYSNESNFVKNNVPIQLASWLQNREERIFYAIDNNIESNSEIQSEWKLFNNPSESYKAKSKNKSVDPLLGNIKWNQGDGWNDECPIDYSSTAGNYRVWAGCVATATAQIMKYWEYPTTGDGYHFYTHPVYGMQEAFFGSTTYQWSSMSDIYPTDAAAELIYHVGVAVEMDYGPNFSGAFIGSNYSYPNAADALIDYFLYKNTLSYIVKDDWTHSSWENLLKDELNNNRPILYAGRNPNNSEGHAFNCDGYDSNDYFHFNWGWSGALNGWFSLYDLTPGDYDFSDDQQAVIGIEPEGTVSSYCSGTTYLSASSDSFSDGSGNNNYSNDSDCEWLIEPTSASSITLSFSSFDLEQGFDYVRVYNGSTTTSTMIGEFSGSTIPSDVTSNTGTMLVHFTSDNSITEDGFEANYSSGGTTTTVSVFKDFNDQDLNSGGWTEFDMEGIFEFWEIIDMYGIDDSPCLKMDGYNNGPVNNEDWFISPPINTINCLSMNFSFYSACNYDGPDLSILISNDYNGYSNPNSYNWYNLDPVLSSNNWEWTYSGSIDISSYQSSNTYIAFLYTSSTYDGAKSWQIDNISINGTIGLNEGNLSSFKLYPNPVKDALFLETIQRNSKLSIRNAMGQKVYDDIVVEDNVEIDFRDFTKGIYFITIIKEDGHEETKKIIKN